MSGVYVIGVMAGKTAWHEIGALDHFKCVKWGRRQDLSLSMAHFGIKMLEILKCILSITKSHKYRHSVWNHVFKILCNLPLLGKISL